MKHRFDHISVFPEHAGVMNTEAVREKLFDLLITGLVDFSLNFLHVWALKQGRKPWLCLEDLNDLHCRVVGGCSLVDEDDDLLAHAQNTAEVFEDDLVHDVVSSLGISHLLHAIEGTL